MRLLTAFSGSVSQTIQQLSYVALIAVGAYLITQGQLTMGGLIACSIISGRALGPLAQIPNMISQWKHAKIALKALDGIMALPRDREAGTRLIVPQHCHGRMRLDQAEFSYTEGQPPALSITNLEFKPGERVAVLGIVGSGKSTLIKLLSGLYQAQAGHLFIDDMDLMHLDPEFIREQIGYLPQDVRLFNGSLRDNLTLGLPTPSDDQILKAASLTGLDVTIHNHPHGLELPISEGGRGMSGGQRQLVGLTRLLMAKPKILLLDEPTASMDAQTEARVMHHLFNEIPKDSLIVIVTHKPTLLPHVQRIVVLDKGKVVLDGPRNAVLEKLRQIGAAQQSETKKQGQESAR